MRRTLIGLVLLSAAGCSGNKDSKIPGDELGTYQVVAQLDSSTCGPGALGSKDLWEFEVKLSQDGRDLYWLNGSEPVAGSLASDGVSFGFDSHTVVTPIPAGKGHPGCAIARTDSGTGKLSSAAPPWPASTAPSATAFSPSRVPTAPRWWPSKAGFTRSPARFPTP